MITRVIDLIDLLEWKRADWLKFFHYEVSWLHAVDLWLGNSTLKLPDIGSFLQLYPTSLRFTNLYGYPTVSIQLQ
jgi:hypothetical protein